MNLIKQRLISQRTRARALQTAVRRWALYGDCVPADIRGELMPRFTPGEKAELEPTLELTRQRLRPVAVHIDTLRRWFEFLFETINQRIEAARQLLDQGRNHECLAVLADNEWRLLNPNAETLAFFNRAMQQRVGHDYHQKLLALDAIIRDLYLPVARLAQQRGVLAKEALCRTPLAYLVDAPDVNLPWRQHAIAAAIVGREIPLALLAVPRQHIADPWNLTALAFEVGLQLYHDLQLGYEMAHKLLRDSLAANVSPATAGWWSLWHETMFADVFGTLRLGSAYVSSMIELMSTDPRAALVGGPAGAAPPPYLRWHVMLQTLQLLGFADEARAHFAQIHMVCGDPAQLAQVFGPLWMQLLGEARAVAGLIAFSPCQKLGGARVIDVVPPLLSADAQQVQNVRDVLLAGDETCVKDEACRWAEGVRGAPAHLALAGLRQAYDRAEDFDASRRLWIRFWCLMQLLTREAYPAREKEDREFAPTEAVLKSFATRGVPAAVAVA